MKINTIINTDNRVGLKQLPDNSVDCCITSPPYFNLRDYGVNEQIGLENTPEEYINQLLLVFGEVYRVLKPTGTLWVVIGDSYAGSMKGGAGFPENAMNYKQGTNRGLLGKATTIKNYSGYKNKDLIGIPWMLAFALRSQGWYLRQDIIWNKPSCMPESVRDRCTKSHEYIFFLSKSAKYYFDQAAIRVPLKDSSIARIAQQEEKNGYKTMKAVRFGGNKYGDSPDKFHQTKSGKAWNPTMAGGGSFSRNGHSGYFDKNGNLLVGPTANKRSVWEVPTQPFKEAHFAVFPENLIKDCILAGCPKGGVILDPFMGSGTTAVVAQKLERNYIGFELNPQYVEIANNRLHAELGLYNSVNY